ncbi:unnamed protein product [Bursaphelenchus xylophilus]|nr:unnamed protein product [Bursaphelenchus xylophilus]CAG9115076.1 unnamed protein product [Bursaphelenchus xylophilus]
MSEDKRNLAKNFLAREFPPFKKSSVLERCREFMPLIAAANAELKRKTEEGISGSLSGISIVPIAKKTKSDDEEEEKPVEEQESSSDSSDSEEEDPNAVEFDIDVRGASDSESEAEEDGSQIPEAFKTPIEKKPKQKLIQIIEDEA